MLIKVGCVTKVLKQVKSNLGNYIVEMYLVRLSAWMLR